MTTAKTIDRLRAALDATGDGSSDFDLNPQFAPKNVKLRPAAVLVGLYPHADVLSVVLTKRSSRLKHHPGQIAFPGGKMDDTDDGLVTAALREAEEEIGLPRSHVSVIGNLPAHQTVTGFAVTPVIGLIERPFDPIPEENEVEEVFHVPFDHVIDPAQFVIQSRRWQGARRHYFTVPYGPYYIWGATARILRGLAERLSTT